jgi:hypothetical protein
MSRDRDLLNILASNAAVNRDGYRSSKLQGRRFENAADSKSCHSNQPCWVTVFTTHCRPSAKLYNCLDAPSFEASTALVQSASVFCFLLAAFNTFFYFPLVWAALHSLINVAEQLLVYPNTLR